MKWFNALAAIVALLTIWETVTPCPGAAAVQPRTDHHANHATDPATDANQTTPLSLIAQCPCGCGGSVDQTARSGVYLYAVVAACTVPPRQCGERASADPAKWSAPNGKIDPIPI